MALVVKKWSASKTPDANGVYVRIEGRESGLLAWLLALIGIDAVTTVEIKENLVVFSQGSLEGKQHRIIPMASICSAGYGYVKPLKQAIALGAILAPFFGLGLIVGPVYYFLNKTLSVFVIENSGWVGGFNFKRSIIEGQNIGEQDAYAVIEIIRGLIERKTA